MRWDEVVELPPETQLALLRDSLMHLLRVDGYWFQAAEELVGLDSALKMDVDVWKRLGRAIARTVKRVYNLPDDGGISTLVQAVYRDPIWTFFADLQMEQLSETRARLRITSCFSQKERIKAGQGVFNCRLVEEPYLQNYAQTIDPRAKVRCRFSPPEKYFENLWCEWYFDLEAGK